MLDHARPSPERREPAGSPFRRVRARWMLALVLAAGLAVELLRRTVFRGASEDAWDALGSLAFQATLAAFLALYLRMRGVDAARLLGGAPRGWRAWALGAVIAPLLVLSLGTAALQFSALATFAPKWAAALNDAGDAAVPPTGLILLQALAGIAAAAVEETLFRGVLLSRWAQRWGAWRAAVASSLAFAVLHLDLLGAFVFGMAMCCIYVRTRSLWIPIAAHGAYNAFIALSDLGSTSGTVSDVPDLRPDWGSAALALLVALPALVWFFRAVPPRRPWTLPYDDARA